MGIAFQAAHAAGNNFADSFQQSKDTKTIDSILSNAMQTQDPAVLQQSIGKILANVSPKNQAAALNFLGQRYDYIEKQNKDKQIADYYKSQNIDPGERFLPPAVQAQNAKSRNAEKQFQNIVGGQAPQQAQPQIGNESAQPVQQPPGLSMKDYSEDQLIRLTNVPGYSESAKQELMDRREEKKIKNKREIAREATYGKRNLDIMSALDADARSMPQQRATHNLMTDAIAKRNMSFFSKDNLAKLTGIDWFLSPESAVFKSQAKQYFLGDLERIKGRANQFIERQIVDAQAKVGQSTGANLSILRAEKNKLDLKEKEIEVANRIYETSGEDGKEPRNLAKLIKDEMTPYAVEKEKEMHNDFVAINTIEDNKNESFVPVKKGTPVSDYVIKALLKRHKNDWQKAENEAKRLGYSTEE